MKESDSPTTTNAHAPTVSVIVPVSNVAPYLHECLDSVRCQDFTDWELILIDDGSTDGSGDICDRYAGVDSRLRVIHQPNQGMSVARNKGLDMARGKYLAFIDSDDVWSPNYLSAMIRLIESEPVDFVCCRQTARRSDLSTPDKQATERVRLIDGDTAALEMLYQTGINVSCCGKLYHRHAWTGHRFREGILYEDLDLLPFVAMSANRIAATDRPLYFYRQRPGSTLHTFNPARLAVLDVTRRLVDRVPPKFRAAAEERAMSAAFNMFCLMKINGMADSDRRRECWDTIRRYRRRSLTGKGVRAKSRLGALLSYVLGRRGVSLLAPLIVSFRDIH